MIQYQAFLVYIAPEGLLPVWLLNIFRLHLDLEPGVPAHITSKTLRYRQDLVDKDIEGGVTYWIQRNNYIQVGKDSVLLLEEVPGVRPKTGQSLCLLFLSLSTY